MDAGRLVDYSLIEINCAALMWSDVSKVHLCCCFIISSANVGFQPQQFDQEEQRAGKPDGKVDPDLSACWGKARNDVFISACTTYAWLFFILHRVEDFCTFAFYQVNQLFHMKANVYMIESFIFVFKFTLIWDIS